MWRISCITLSANWEIWVVANVMRLTCIAAVWALRLDLHSLSSSWEQENDQLIGVSAQKLRKKTLFLVLKAKKLFHYAVSGLWLFQVLLKGSIMGIQKINRCALLVNTGSSVLYVLDLSVSLWISLWYISTFNTRQRQFLFSCTSPSLNDRRDKVGRYQSEAEIHLKSEPGI